MPKDSDFAALMEHASGAGQSARQVKRGEVVEGTVIQIGGDSVFVDIGTRADARIALEELQDSDGKLQVKLGDRVRATVIETRADGPVLALSVGRGSQPGAEALRLSKETGAPVVGRVTQAIKGGIEVEVSGVRAFCPASQLETGRVEDLERYVGQTLEFAVMELRDRSAVLSRRVLLERQRAERQEQAVTKLLPGADVDGTVQSTNRHGAVVDLDGVEGFIPISELSNQRIQRVEDVVSVGDRVSARVLSVQRGDRGISIRLSMKGKAVARDETRSDREQVVTAKVTGAVPAGIFVDTPIGSGLVPASELELAPGADHRRAYPVGRELKVVLARRDSSGKLSFSAKGVAGVEERANYREFSATATSNTSTGTLGSLGDLLKNKLGDVSQEQAAEQPPEEQPRPASPTSTPGVTRRKRN
jgi:small subunit ribosomal protein S1